MLKIEEMTKGEIQALLLRASFGHLGCSRDGHTYVVPMNYAYDGEDLYFLTTEGTKTEFISANSEVCFQIEEVADPTRWRSVMVQGHAKRITRQEEIESAMQFITESNPELTPALNRTEIGQWHRANKIALYRIHPDAVYGRKTA